MGLGSGENVIASVYELAPGGQMGTRHYPGIEHIREGATAETQHLLDIIDQQYEYLDQAGWFKQLVLLRRDDGTKEMLSLNALERERDLLRAVVDLACVDALPVMEALRTLHALAPRAREVLASTSA